MYASPVVMDPSTGSTMTPVAGTYPSFPSISTLLFAYD